MKMESLHKLYVHQLKDIYSAESQMLQAIPKMAEAAKDDELTQAFHDHLKETKQHIERLQQIFKGLDFEPGGHKCKAMEGLIQEATDLVNEDIEPAVIDAGLIAAAQRIEHYEIASYGSARAYAEKLGFAEAADLLDKTLQEEGETDRQLSRLAERRINFLAMSLG